MPAVRVEDPGILARHAKFREQLNEPTVSQIIGD
jgi:hypothetical protein